MNPSDCGDKEPGLNPAMPLLYTLGCCGAISGVAAIPVGLFVGPQVLGAGVALVGLSSTAIWLARRRYDRWGRYATIAWSVTTLTVIAAATVWQPPPEPDTVATVWVALLLLMVAGVLMVAVRKRVG